jgi:hypothetical protein
MMGSIIASIAANSIAAPVINQLQIVAIKICPIV